MSTNAIKLLNIQYVLSLSYTGEPLKDCIRYDVMRHIAAKIIGAGC